MEIKKTYVTNTKFFYQTTVNGKHFDADTEAELVQMVERENECKFGQKAWLRYKSLRESNHLYPSSYSVSIDGIENFEFVIPSQWIKGWYVEVTVLKKDEGFYEVRIPTTASFVDVIVYAKDVLDRLTEEIK